VAESRFDGQTVVLVGRAEPLLIDATMESFHAAGAIVSRVDEGALGDIDGLDVCVCFARPGTTGPLRELDSISLDAALEAAFDRPRRSIMAAARAMASDGGGAIVVVGSPDVSHAYPGRAPAAMAMGGLMGLIRCIAVEFSERSVRANLIIVGPLGDPDGAAFDADQALLERTRLRSPMQRLGRPVEVAQAIRFVASADTAFMTGQSLRVDGGWASLNQAPAGMRFP
jgi:NAD(P)-dependent dehydrogenase (short-subunit alcohol dehydrogenase family)